MDLNSGQYKISYTSEEQHYTATKLILRRMTTIIVAHWTVNLTAQTCSGNES